MNVTEESCRDSFRSRVSSPGMPNTYLTPSASRHSTNRSDALRELTCATPPHAVCRANVDGSPDPMTHLRFATLTAVLALLVPTVAQAKTTFTIKGAGFGHGVGMSQYGAMGCASHGWTAAAILGHYYTGSSLGTTDPNRRVRIQLVDETSSARISGARQAGSRRLDPAVTYTLK